MLKLIIDEYAIVAKVDVSGVCASAQREASPVSLSELKRCPVKTLLTNATALSRDLATLSYAASNDVTTASCSWQDDLALSY